MKLTIAWNVWDNYDDILLGSEIARLSNAESNSFDDLYLVSQGGYKTNPNKNQSRYIDQHFFVEIDEDNPLILVHSKYKAALRVMKGIFQAYQVAASRDSDFVLITNADAWCLDLKRLLNLLNRSDVRDKAISARIGLVTGMDINFGCYVPYFDDHFIILNINLCRKHKIFDNPESLAYCPHFGTYGGIHYMLSVLIDEFVPQGMFNAYTHCEDCVNHFGEKSGYSLLPWQYQPEYGFLHANCQHEADLHYLRAAMLIHRGLERFPEIGLYCKSYKSEINFKKINKEYICYPLSIKDKFLLSKIRIPYKIYQHYVKFYYNYTGYAIKKSLIDGNKDNALKYFNLYSKIYPLALASRRYNT